jgi:hypothetical protein
MLQVPAPRRLTGSILAYSPNRGAGIHPNQSRHERRLLGEQIMSTSVALRNDNLAALEATAASRSTVLARYRRLREINKHLAHQLAES